MREAAAPGPEPDQASALTTRWTQVRSLHGADAEQAWRWFVGRYRHFIRGILHGVLRLPHEVDAAEQEFWGYVFMSGALQRADTDRRFRPFLAGIVRNFARAGARKRGFQLADEDAVANLPQRDSDAGEQMIWVQNVVSNALRALREEHEGFGIAMSRFYGLAFDGSPHEPWPVKRVAGELGVSNQSVYLLLFRGRKRLRKLVEDELREGCADAESLRDELLALLQVAAARLPGMLDEGNDTSRHGSQN